MLLWDEISGNLTIKVQAAQQQHAITLSLHCISVFPGAAHIWNAGRDGWHGVSGLKIKVDIWRVKMIYFGKGIFICTSSRGGHGKGKAFSFFFRSILNLLGQAGVFKVLCHEGFVWHFLLLRNDGGNLNHHHFSEKSNYGHCNDTKFHQTPRS